MSSRVAGGGYRRVVGMDDPWRCRSFEATLVMCDDGLELQITGEVRGPGPVTSVSLRPHEAQGFNELDLLVGIVAERSQAAPAARRGWIPVELMMPTRTRYTTVTITDCGATSTVRDASASA
jgi:hypothetical protein